jgi:DNA-binding NtrC family response regulator
MEKQHRITVPPTETLTVLSISPHDDDQSLLKAILGHSRWALLSARDVFAARALLSQRPDISVVLCERDLNPGTWVDVLNTIQTIAHPPSLIVSSRLADERLWCEVLNLGGWDVLAKPFDRTEVLRSVQSAQDQWCRRNEIRHPVKVMTAVG